MDNSLLTSIDSKPRKPLVVYFKPSVMYHADISHDISTLENLLGCNFICANNWGELADCFTENIYIDLIIVRSDMLEFDSKLNRGGLVRMIDCMRANILPESSPLRYAMIFDSSLCSTHVHAAKSLGIAGGLPAPTAYTLFDTANSLKSLLNSEHHWPEVAVTLTSDVAPKPHIVYFRADNGFPEERRQLLESALEADVITCNDWPSLTKSLATDPVSIIVHCDTITAQSTTVNAFFNMMKSLSGYVTGHAGPSIAVVIEPYTTSLFVSQLETAGCMGIVPSMAGWGIGETSLAIGNISHNILHWPRHVISQLPGYTDTSLPTLAYFRENNKTLPDASTCLGNGIACVVTEPATWPQLTDELHRGTQYLVFHADMLSAEDKDISGFVDMVSSLEHFVSPGTDLKIAAIISKNTDIKVVKGLQKTTVSGVVLDSGHFPADDAETALNLFLAGKPHWPKHVIQSLPGSTVKSSMQTGQHLTTRQSQVLTLVCNRGLSNKQIASTLKISESTVKIHVSAILKEYGVRNRTQLALAATTALRA